MEANTTMPRAHVVLREDDDPPHVIDQLVNVDMNTPAGRLVRLALRAYVHVMSDGHEHLTGDEDTSAEIRKWARDHHKPISDRGRIPLHLHKEFLAYQLMHGDDDGDGPTDGNADKGDGETGDDERRGGPTKLVAIDGYSGRAAGT